MAGAKRNAKIEITSSAAGLAPGLADARRQLRSFSREQQREAKQRERDEKRRAKEHAKQLKAANKGLGGALGQGAGMAAGFAGIGAISEAVTDVFAVEKEMTRFQIDAQLGADKMAAFREQILKTSEATGVSRNAIVHAAHAYQILTGDAQGAISSSELFAKVANASGASMDEIAAAAAAMRQSIKLDPADFQKGFDIFLKLGHEGSIELRDVAAEMSGLMPQFKDFGNKSQLDKLAEMAATMEVVKFNFANAAETATGFRAAMTAVSKSKVAANLEAHGVKVWEIDPKTKQHVKRDFVDIVKDIHDKIKDKKVLADVLGGRQESYRAILALIDNYDKYVELKNQALNSDQVAKDNATYMASATGRMAMAWEHIKNAIAEAFTPERIEAFANVVGKVAGFVGDLAHMLNPSDEEFQGAAIAGLTETQMNKGQGAAVEQARAMMRGEYDSSIEGIQDLASTGGFENRRAAAKKYLESQNYDVGQHFKIGQTPEDTTADLEKRGRAQAAMFSDPEGFARQTGQSVASELARLLGPLLSSPPPVKIGAEPIVKAGNNSVLQRTRPGGRS